MMAAMDNGSTGALAEQIAVFKQLDQKRDRAALTADEQRRWQDAKEAIERLTAAPGEAVPPSSRRLSLRVPAHLEVTFEDADGFARAYLRNISEGGVYVESERPMRMRDRFQLTIVVRQPGETLELPVEVVWVNGNPSPSSGLKPGVGVAWLDLTPANKEIIKGIVHASLDEMAKG
jgi:uncharacterized protein (TIGR02266 family)